MKKRLVSAFCALALAVSCMGFIGCKKDDAEAPANKVMNVSLNPSVEFILDTENKVVSVNALNDEGNLILSAAATANKDFVGATDGDALKIYVEVCKNAGYLVSGSISSGENEIKISVSGEDAEKTYNEVKAAAEKYFNELKITASVKKDEIEKTLDELVAECVPYIDAAKAKAMSEREKLAELAKARKETAEMYSEELKQMYYNAKAEAYKAAELEYAKKNVSEAQAKLLEIAADGYAASSKTLDDLYYASFVKEDSLYQQSLKAVHTKKTDYLKCRNALSELKKQNETEPSEELAAKIKVYETLLENYKSALDLAEEGLTSANTAAQKSLASAHTALDAAYDSAVKIITSAGDKSNELLDNMSKEATKNLDDYSSKFETTYTEVSTAVKKTADAWKEMYENLQKEFEEPEA